MTDNDATEADTDEKHSERRSPRTVRFSDPEWDKVEKAAAKRNLSPATFVRNAALADAANQNAMASGAVPPEVLELIKRIYRGTYMLSTLKRDEMIREGRGEEVDRTVQAARDIQDFLLDDTSK